MKQLYLRHSLGGMNAAGLLSIEYSQESANEIWPVFKIFSNTYSSKHALHL